MTDPVAQFVDGGRRPCALLFEDDEVLRFVAEKVLRKKGIDVISFGDGYVDRALIERLDFDVALVDLGLPGHSGHEIIEILRNSKTSAGTSVFIITSSPEPVDTLRSSGYFNVTVSQKPIDWPALVQRIEEAIAARSESFL